MCFISQLAATTTSNDKTSWTRLPESCRQRAPKQAPWYGHDLFPHNTFVVRVCVLAGEVSVFLVQIHRPLLCTRIQRSVYVSFPALFCAFHTRIAHFGYFGADSTSTKLKLRCSVICWQDEVSPETRSTYFGLPIGH